jgi:hypothetical protein
MMRKLLWLSLWLCFVTSAAAQSKPVNYTHQSTSVASTTVPTCVMGPASMTTWCLTLRGASTNPVLCFAYLGNSTPGAAPAGCAIPNGVVGQGCQEIQPGTPLCDAVTVNTPRGIAGAMGEGWACILETGAAETVDASYR